jgi:RluA family pseudouridine synthase
MKKQKSYEEFFENDEQTSKPQKPTKKPTFDLEGNILFEDENYILVNKPPFISSLEDRHERVNVLNVARQYVKTAQLCHRLDKDTSGVLAIAKNPEAYRHLSIQFEKRQVVKIYHAVVDGIHNFSNMLVDEPILKLDDGVVKLSKRDGKAAQTYFTSLKSYRLHTLVECRPVTGRMHQIRIHLASQKASITGDTTYGGKPFLLSELKRKFNLKKGTEEESFMKRMALHAYSLEFNDLSEKRQVIQAPYPKDFQALLRQLEQNR